MVLCLELGVIWLIYCGFGLISTYDMPIWATAMLVITVDRATSKITGIASKRRERLRDGDDDPEPGDPCGTRL